MEYLICFQSAKNAASSIIQVLHHLGMYSITPLSYSVPITPSLTETPDIKRCDVKLELRYPEKLFDDILYNTKLASTFSSIPA